MSKKQKIIAAFVVVVALALGINWWVNYGKESTDDATIEAHIIPISPDVSGYVTALHVRDNQEVKKGDVIAEIDPRDYQLRLDSANANMLSAEVAAKNADINARRQLAIGKAAGAQKDIDNAVSTQGTSKAALDNAHAQVELAERNLNHTKILAPQDGYVTMRSVEQGAYANVGQQLMVLVGKERWVVANFKEVQITEMKPGQRVKIHVDAYPKLKLKGTVDSIQSGTGAEFSAFPPENATGNFVKIVQRVPVKIRIDSTIPDDVVLGPGLSVQPTVFTHDKDKR